MSRIDMSIVPTGGALSLSIYASGAAMTLSRGLSGTPGFTQIYSGAPQALYIDVGDGTSAPLASGTYVQYQMVDANGTLTTPYILPATLLNIEQEPITPLLIKLFTASLNNLTRPPGIAQLQQVLQSMPIAGFPTMPFVTINNDLTQQKQIPIGQNVPNYDAEGNWIITGLCDRTYRISILANDSPTRDFFKDAIVGTFQSIMQTVLNPLGINVHHRYQAAAGQVAKDPAGMGPGFYYADVMCEFSGTYNIQISSLYGVISTITVTEQYGDGVSDTQVVPLTGP